MNRFQQLFVILAVSHVSLISACKPHVRKLNDGHEMPIVALGTYPYSSIDDEPLDIVRQSVVWAIEAGYRHIDTATLYGDETQVGQGIAEAIAQGLICREDVFISTKLFNDQHRRNQVVPALKKSLKLLDMDYVDLYMIHFPTATTSDNQTLDIDYLETWQGMEEAQSLGLTRSIGVANFNSSQIARISANSKVVPAVSQFEVNPTATHEPLVSYCLDHGIQVMAYAPFGFAVPRKGQLDTKPPPQFNDQVMQTLAAKYKKTPAQILIRYLIDRGTSPIPKSTKKSHIFENIDVFDFCLDEEDIATLSHFNLDKRVYTPETSVLKDHPYYPYQQY